MICKYSYKKLFIRYSNAGFLIHVRWCTLPSLSGPSRRVSFELLFDPFTENCLEFSNIFDVGYSTSYVETGNTVRRYEVHQGMSSWLMADGCIMPVSFNARNRELWGISVN